MTPTVRVSPLGNTQPYEPGTGPQSSSTRPDQSLPAGLGAAAAAALGCLTGIGGGVLRDVLAGVVPVVLRREVYAVPALLGAAVVVAAHGQGVRGPGILAAAAALVFGLRMLGVWRDWHAPAAPQRRSAPVSPPGG